MATTRRNSRRIQKESAVKRERKNSVSGESSDSNDDEDEKKVLPQSNGHDESPKSGKDVETIRNISSPNAKAKSDTIGGTSVKKEEAPEPNDDENKVKQQPKKRTKFDHVAAQNFDQLEKAVLDCERELDIFRNEQEAERAATNKASPQKTQTTTTSPKSPTSPPDRPRRKRAYSCIMKEAMETKAELAKHKHGCQKNISHKLQKIRKSFNFKVEVVAEALSVYRRNIDTDDGHGAALVFPDVGKKGKKRPSAKEKEENDEENTSNIVENDADKMNIIERAESLLSIWRMALQSGDKISCPDYHDQYVCDDEKRGWVKLFKAEIVDCMDGDAIQSDYGYYLKNNDEMETDGKDDLMNIPRKARKFKESKADSVKSSCLAEEKKVESAENGNSLKSNGKDENKSEAKQQKDPPRISLGDSSLNDSSKYTYELLSTEKAIKVHYIGYPKEENRWLLLTGELGDWHSSSKGPNKSKGSDALIQPLETHRLSEYALKKEYGLSDSEFERSDEETESMDGEKDDSTSKKRKKAKVPPGKKRRKPQPPASPPSVGKKRRRNPPRGALDMHDVDSSNKSNGKAKLKLWTKSEDELLSRFIVDHIKETSDNKGGKVDWKNVATPKASFWELIAPVGFPDRSVEALRKRYLKIIPDITKNQLASETKTKRSSPRQKQRIISDVGESHDKQAKKPVSPTKKRKATKSSRELTDSKSNEQHKAPSPLKKEAHAAPPQLSSPTKRRKNGIKSDPNTSMIKEKKSKSKGRSSRATGDEDTSLEFTWICTACREAECVTDPTSPLLVCEGRCFRPFHYPCAGLASLPPEGETWICSDCKQGKHQCAVCHEYGIDDQDVYCCDNKGCGLFFHEACLSMYDVDIKIVEETITSGESAADTEASKTISKEEKSTRQTEEVSQVQSNDEDRLEGQVDGKSQPFERSRSRPKFKCPAHKCWTCATDIPTVETGDDAKEMKSAKGQAKFKGKRKATQSLLSICFSSKKERVFRCLDCPNAYHITCLPPSCRFHELALLCHEHSSSSKLPDLDVDNSFQKDVEATADKKLELICQSNNRKINSSRSTDKKGRKAAKSAEQVVYENKFLPGMKGSVKSIRESHFIQQLDKHTVSYPHQNSLYCLPCDFQKEVQSKPPTYSHVHCLKYIPSNRPKRRPPCDEACRCTKSDVDGVPACGEDCLNRMMYVECVGNSDATRGEKNPYWNCNNGTNCGNRVISQRQGAKCRPKRERGKGWGLVTLNNIKKGDYVQEYAGEVIDEETMQQRLKSWTRDHPNDPNFYIMRLEPGWYIDAREKGNLSRFINHSCDPNCHLVPVNVAGWMRVAIVCTRDIKAGEFLSYDYQFDTKHGEKFVCRCGAKNCRGTMKGGKGSLAQDSKDGTGSEKKTKKQLLAEAKARLEKDKKFLTEIDESEKERLNQIGILVPGEIKDGNNTVASGPQLGCKDSAQKNRIFLWRTALIGADLSARHWRLTKPKITADSKGRPLSNSDGKLVEVDILTVIKRSNTV